MRFKAALTLMLLYASGALASDIAPTGTLRAGTSATIRHRPYAIRPPAKPVAHPRIWRVSWDGVSTRPSR
jgi:hypothetical protein